MIKKKLLLLHSTCCYFKDTIHLNAELESVLKEYDIESYHLLTDGNPCTYFAELDEPKEIRCRETRSMVLSYLTSTKNHVFQMEDFVSRVDPKKISQWWDNNKHCDLQAILFNQLNLWEIIKGSLAAFLKWDSVPKITSAISEQDRRIVERFLLSCARYLLALEEVFKSIQPTHILIFNGLLYLERAAYEVARRYHISVLATESSCFADRKYFDSSGVIGNRHSYSRMARHSIEAKRLTQAQKQELNEYLHNVYTGKNNFIQQSEPSKAEVKDKLGIPSSKTIVTFFGQVPHDSVIVYDSEIYPGVYEAIKDTIRIFTRFKHVHLIIRLHPGGHNTGQRDNSILNRLLQSNIPENVSIVHSKQINTYDIMKESSLGITICSQTGLEMLSMHKPVITLGKAFYSQLGFTFDVMNLELYSPIARLALSNLELSDSIKDRIDTYLYYFIFDYLVPVDRSNGLVQKEGIQKILRLIL